MNELLFFITIFLYFGGLCLVNKFFGKAGLYAWIALMTILANIELTKTISLFGFNDYVTLGNVAFASIFLATDILSENYGYEAGKKGAYIGFCSVVAFLVFIQIDIAFIPTEYGMFMHEHLSSLFGISGQFVWVTIASVLMFFLSNLLDVWLFDKIKQKTGGKMLWVRNNVATIIANCSENFLLFIFGFYVFPLLFTGSSIYTFTQALTFASVSCIIEIFVSVLDTPFVYLAKKYPNKEIAKIKM